MCVNVICECVTSNMLENLGMNGVWRVCRCALSLIRGYFKGVCSTRRRTGSGIIVHSFDMRVRMLMCFYTADYQRVR